MEGFFAFDLAFALLDLRRVVPFSRPDGSPESPPEFERVLDDDERELDDAAAAAEAAACAAA